MSCHFKCPKNNFAYLFYSILHHDSLNNEFIGHYLLCSTKCMKRFKEECTYMDENGYIYYKEIKEIPVEKYPDGYCPMSMIERVEYHKTTSMATSYSSLYNEKNNDDDSPQPTMLMN